MGFPERAQESWQRRDRAYLKRIVHEAVDRYLAERDLNLGFLCRAADKFWGARAFTALRAIAQPHWDGRGARNMLRVS